MGSSPDAGQAAPTTKPTDSAIGSWLTQAKNSGVHGGVQDGSTPDTPSLFGFRPGPMAMGNNSSGTPTSSVPTASAPTPSPPVTSVPMAPAPMLGMGGSSGGPALLGRPQSGNFTTPDMNQQDNSLLGDAQIQSAASTPQPNAGGLNSFQGSGSPAISNVLKALMGAY